MRRSMGAGIDPQEGYRLSIPFWDATYKEVDEDTDTYNFQFLSGMRL